MMKIRRERKGDYPAVGEIHELAFKGTTEARLVETLRDSDDFMPGLSMVAVQGRKVVGHILFSLVSIQTKGGSVPAHRRGRRRAGVASGRGAASWAEGR